MKTGVLYVLAGSYEEYDKWARGKDVKGLTLMIHSERDARGLHGVSYVRIGTWYRQDYGSVLEILRENECVELQDSDVLAWLQRASAGDKGLGIPSVRRARFSKLTHNWANLHDEARRMGVALKLDPSDPDTLLVLDPTLHPGDVGFSLLPGGAKVTHASSHRTLLPRECQGDQNLASAGKVSSGSTE